VHKGCGFPQLAGISGFRATLRRQLRTSASGHATYGGNSAGDATLTPLGLDAPSLHDALHHYRSRLRMLMDAIEREPAVTRFASVAPSLLEELVTTVEVDTAVRELPEGQQRMSPLERNILAPLLIRLRCQLDQFQLESPTRACLPRLQSLDRLVGEAELALSRPSRQSSDRTDRTMEFDRTG
jgi:hypothetical protein